MFLYAGAVHEVSVVFMFDVRGCVAVCWLCVLCGTRDFNVKHGLVVRSSVDLLEFSCHTTLIYSPYCNLSLRYEKNTKWSYCATKDSAP